MATESPNELTLAKTKGCSHRTIATVIFYRDKCVL